MNSYVLDIFDDFRIKKENHLCDIPYPSFLTTSLILDILSITTVSYREPIEETIVSETYSQISEILEDESLDKKSDSDVESCLSLSERFVPTFAHYDSTSKELVYSSLEYSGLDTILGIKDNKIVESSISKITSPASSFITFQNGEMSYIPITASSSMSLMTLSNTEIGIINIKSSEKCRLNLLSLSDHNITYSTPKVNDPQNYILTTDGQDISLCEYRILTSKNIKGNGIDSPLDIVIKEENVKKSNVILTFDNNQITKSTIKKFPSDGLFLSMNRDNNIVYSNIITKSTIKGKGTITEPLELFIKDNSPNLTLMHCKDNSISVSVIENSKNVPNILSYDNGFKLYTPIESMNNENYAYFDNGRLTYGKLQLHTDSTLEGLGTKDSKLKVRFRDTSFQTNIVSFDEESSSFSTHRIQRGYGDVMLYDGKSINYNLFLTDKGLTGNGTSKKLSLNLDKTPTNRIVSFDESSNQLQYSEILPLSKTPHNLIFYNPETNMFSYSKIQYTTIESNPNVLSIDSDGKIICSQNVIFVNKPIIGKGTKEEPLDIKITSDPKNISSFVFHSKNSLESVNISEIPQNHILTINTENGIVSKSIFSTDSTLYGNGTTTPLGVKMNQGFIGEYVLYDKNMNQFNSYSINNETSMELACFKNNRLCKSVIKEKSTDYSLYISPSDGEISYSKIEKKPLNIGINLIGNGEDSPIDIKIEKGKISNFVSHSNNSFQKVDIQNKEFSHILTTDGESIGRFSFKDSNTIKYDDSSFHLRISDTPTTNFLTLSADGQIAKTSVSKSPTIHMLSIDYDNNRLCSSPITNNESGYIVNFNPLKNTFHYSEIKQRTNHNLNILFYDTFEKRISYDSFPQTTVRSSGILEGDGSFDSPLNLEVEETDSNISNVISIIDNKLVSTKIKESSVGDIVLFNGNFSTISLNEGDVLVKREKYESSTSMNDSIGIGIKTLLSNKGEYNTAYGSNALSSNINGTNNTANGAYSQFMCIEGNYNTTYGTRTLMQNTIGNHNSGYGAETLRIAKSDYNSGFGSNVMISLTEGKGNSAFGCFSLQGVINGDGNSAFGFSSMKNGNGKYNTSFGYCSLENCFGNYNTAVGTNSQKKSKSSNNSSLGCGSLENVVGAIGCTAIGFKALNLNENGDGNTATGYQSLLSCVGRYNTAYGANSGINCSGNNNLMLGADCGKSLINGNNNILIQSDCIISGNNNIIIGNVSKEISQYISPSGSDQIVLSTGCNIGTGSLFIPNIRNTREISQPTNLEYNTKTGEITCSYGFGSFTKRENIENVKVEEDRYISDKIDVISYSYKGGVSGLSGRKSMGISYEDLKEIFPLAITGDSINYQTLVLALILENKKIIKELEALKNAYKSG